MNILPFVNPKTHSEHTPLRSNCWPKWNSYPKIKGSVSTFFKLIVLPQLAVVDTTRGTSISSCKLVLLYHISTAPSTTCSLAFVWQKEGNKCLVTITMSSMFFHFLIIIVKPQFSNLNSKNKDEYLVI